MAECALEMDALKSGFGGLDNRLLTEHKDELLKGNALDKLRVEIGHTEPVEDFAGGLLCESISPHALNQEGGRRLGRDAFLLSCFGVGVDDGLDLALRFRACWGGS